MMLHLMLKKKLLKKTDFRVMTYLNTFTSNLSRTVQKFYITRRNSRYTFINDWFLEYRLTFYRKISWNSVS